MQRIIEIGGALTFSTSVVAFMLNQVGYPAMLPVSLAAGLAAVLLQGRYALLGLLLVDGIGVLLWRTVAILQTVI